jgi:nitrite reductase/ring-hydroxylating ferredoxin subunit
MSVKIGDRIYENGKEFIAVEFASNLTENKGTLIRLGEEIEQQVALFRHQGKLFCLSNICPHRHQPSIYRGYVENGCVTCPEHFWTYRLDTGENINQKQGIKKLKTYEVIEKDGVILIHIDYFEKPKWKEFKEINGTT